MINRITAMANPRPMERVVPGVSFNLDLAYRVIDTEDGGAADEKNFQEVVLKALALVQRDYLGGCGSRAAARSSSRTSRMKQENRWICPTSNRKAMPCNGMT